jgi:hypothetical protein
MDRKQIIGKTAFFIAVVLFVSLFGMLLGSSNMLVGVFVVMGMLMMSAVDMSHCPKFSFIEILAMCLALGICPYIASFDPWLGLVVNFVTVFAIAIVTMHDIRHPMYFPFILGYAFLLSVPVGGTDLLLRVIGMAIGAAAIVAYNLFVNRGRAEKACREGITALMGEVANIAEARASGKTADNSGLVKARSSVYAAVTDSLSGRYTGTQRSQFTVAVAASLSELGNAVSRSNDTDLSADVTILMRSLRVDGIDAWHMPLRKFIDGHRGTDEAVLSCLDTPDRALISNNAGGKDDGFFIGTRISEDLRTDSPEFSFALRLASMIAIAEFVVSYFGIPDAKWIAFTAIAIVQPYIDDTWKKSMDRAFGTVLGVAIFCLIEMVVWITSMDAMLAVSICLLGISYATVLRKPKTYRFTVMFNTIMALLTASIVETVPTVAADRLLFIAIGIMAAIAINHLVLPFRLMDGIADAAKRLVDMEQDHLQTVIRTANGEEDPYESTVVAVRSDLIMGRLVSLKGNMSDERIDGIVERHAAFSSASYRALSSIANGIRSTAIKKNDTADNIMKRCDKATVDIAEAMRLHTENIAAVASLRRADSAAVD